MFKNCCVQELCARCVQAGAIVMRLGSERDDLLGEDGYESQEQGTRLGAGNI